MENSRTKNASRNMLFGVFNKIIYLLAPFFIRTIIIYTLGVEYIGLNSLFTSILNVLNLAELGISSAIVFSMYSAIAQNDNNTLCALSSYYKKTYRIIGIVVLFLGLLIMPFLKYLISGEVPNDLNIYVLFGFYLAQTCFSYFIFSYKSCLFTAYQRSDVVSNISSIVYLLLFVCQATVLLTLKNYYIYISFLPLSTIINNIFLHFLAKKNYPNIVPKGELDISIRININKKVKSLFLYKIGGVVLSSVDTVIISSVLGLVELGKYNNYYFIITALFSFFSIFYSSLTAGIGNSLNVDSYEKNYNDFKKLTFINAFMVSWCTTCLFCLYQPFIQVWVGEKYMYSIAVVILLSLYFYVWKMMEIINLYKDAGGLWEHDKYRPLIASIVNLIVNIALVYIIGIYGIIISTIVSVVVVILPWSTYVLFKYKFNLNIRYELKKYIIKVVLFFLITIIVTFICYNLCQIVPQVTYFAFFIRALICFVISTTLYLFFFSFFEEYSIVRKWLLGKIKKLFGGKHEKKE